MDIRFHTSIRLVAAWFGASLTCLILSSLSFYYLSRTRVVEPVSQNFKLYAALPQSSMEVSQNVNYTDARSALIKNFFAEYNSPLVSYSSIFVNVADKYKLDYKLLPSIAMQESKGGQKVIKGSFNPFGYGIYGDLVIKFSSWEEGIERVGRALREDYLDQGLKTPIQIMAKYTPPSLAKGGTWAKGVSSFMHDLQ